MSKAPTDPTRPDPTRSSKILHSGKSRIESEFQNRLPQLMERPELRKSHDSSESASSDDVPASLTRPGHEAAFDEEEEDNDQALQFTPGSTISNITPLTGYSSSQPSWNAQSQSQPKPKAGTTAETHENPRPLPNGMASPRPQRPSAPARTPSSTYNPPRKPSHYVSLHSNRQRSFSNTRRRDPNAQYRAQEKAYIEQLRQDPNSYYSDELYTPSLAYSTDSETEEESPSSEVHFDNDNYDQDTQLFYNNDDLLPSVEELQVPENRERLEWHSMLASVLKGDVVKQEKQRLIGTTESKGEKALSNEIWLGVRSRVCGRSLAAQKRMVEDGRAGLSPEIESIISFQIKGETEVGKPAAKQVEDVVQRIERCESLYPTRGALLEAHTRAASIEFRDSCEAVYAWHNTTELINTELAILQNWVGNEELDFTKKPNAVSSEGASLTDDASFLERIHKDDGLKSLHGDHSMLLGVAEVIRKAKTTLINNAEAFAKRHLPPYIEELLTLINFPSRLVQEIIRMRLAYAQKMKDPLQLSTMMAAQVISQFQILLKLAVRIKQDYTVISQPEPGWDLPPCIDDNFDLVVLDALKFYFKMLNSKLVGNKNTFKEAEILEQEWEFSNSIGRFLDGGDVEVAEQFSGLTAKALQRLTTHFERDLQRRPEENAAEADKRYKQILDSARVRQRKLFRFSRLLSQRFENATDFSIAFEPAVLRDLLGALIASGHFLVDVPRLSSTGIYLIASPTLYDRPRNIQSILGTSFRSEDDVEDSSNPYVLILLPDKAFFWDSKRVEVDMRAPSMDIKPNRLRLVADGSQQRLINARLALFQSIGTKLDILTETRANLPRVNLELGKIKKTAYKLSNTIMESVEIIRKQTTGLENQELIQTCFAFATEFGKRSVTYMDVNRRLMNNLKLTRLGLDWVSFICDDCVASDRKTFKWAVVALEFAMVMTQGPNILSITDEEFTRLRTKVAGCMSLLISHFDIMGARSTLAAQAERQRVEALAGQFRKLDISRMKDDAEASSFIREQWLAQLAEIDEVRKQRDAERQPMGRVLEASNEADRSLTFLSSSATNAQLRWQQGQFVGGGTFGSVYAAINLDSGYLMAVKEIRLQDPQLIPTVAGQIRDEQAVLEVLDHPNIVSYYGIEVHRDKVYIFMEYCSGGSLASLLEHGRIEDETVIQVYALQMLEGLAYLHQSGICHRDIKPENILLDHNGVIKYVDFGAAKVIARQNKTLQPDHNVLADPTTRLPGKQKSMTGTPMYMSPEVIKGTNEGRQGAIDVWSLGCVILEMSTGRRPWASLDNEWAIMYNIAQGNPPQLPSRDQLSPEGIDFLRRCFEKDPRRRASAAELLQCEWIMKIRQQVVVGGGSDSPVTSESSHSNASSRQNSNVF
ncbi:MAG: Suppressor of Sensor Kinase (SLN1) [Heterodermia speciosa]|uniref:MAP kinase kinase kinase n=1 Tax=Heterodermia speciosa TaxID=116794 RepID=A0A8H3IEE0_9LECA|nr:MAG: Suppressor of Sensor Kinase (SLN1) [Heterodermia speciosa]